MPGSTGIIKGSIMRVYIATTAIAKTTDCSIEFSVGERTVSHKDVTDNWGAVEAGEYSCTISTNALYADDDGDGFAALWTAYSTKAFLTLRFSTQVAGDDYFTGSFMITSLSINAPNNESTTFSASFKNNGAITRPTV